MDNNEQNKKSISQIQNRKQKRQIEKTLKTSGKSKEDLNQMINVINMMNGFNTDDFLKFKECLLEGDKVKLDVDGIKSHPSWDRYSSDYKKFVEDNENVIFTVEYDKNTDNKPNVICLKEDKSRQRWRFWDGNVFVLDERDGKFKKLYMIRESNEGGQL